MTKNPERSIKIKNETGKSNRNCPFRMNVHNDTLPNKKSEYPYGYSDWSECNYRTWKNPVISMVLVQQARGSIFKKHGL